MLWLGFLSTAMAIYDLHLLADQTTARCLDGSPYGLYIERDKDNARLFIFMDSGGTCANGSLQNSFQTCYNRSKTSLGSTRNYKSTNQFEGHGVLYSSEDNPFKDWRKVFMIYCDGTEYQGSRNEPVPVEDTHLYFRGKDNVQAAFQYLNQTVGLFRAQKVVLTGGSAGGIGTFFWSNYLYMRMERPQSLYSIPDSGLFLIDYPNPYTNTSMVIQRCQELLDFVLRGVGLSIPECNEDEENRLLCFNAIYLIPLLKGRFMLIESPYDQWSIRNILTIDCTGHSQPGSLVNCDEHQKAHIESYRKASIEALTFFTAHGFSLWSPACIQHVFSDSGSFNSDSFRVGGMKLAQAMELFTRGVKGIWQDLDPWPYNKRCAGAGLIKTDNEDYNQ